jgi:hypothetical protein
VPQAVVPDAVQATEVPVASFFDRQPARRLSGPRESLPIDQSIPPLHGARYETPTLLLAVASGALAVAERSAWVLLALVPVTVVFALRALVHARVDTSEHWPGRYLQRHGRGGRQRFQQFCDRNNGVFMFLTVITARTTV